MKAANKDGWIRHRGGKCPVEKGVRVDVRMRKLVLIGELSDSLDWRHTEYLWPDEIMAYRLHKPAEQQPETISKIADECAELAGLANRLEQVDESLRKCEGQNCKISDVGEHSKECLLDAAIDQGWAGPLEWRDRITTIDFDIHSLTNERAELVQKLASEGLQLLDVEKPVARPVEDMSDWRNWKVGDFIECKETLYPNLYTPERLYKVKETYADGVHIYDDVGGFSSCKFLDHELSGFKFHSRPAK